MKVVAYVNKDEYCPMCTRVLPYLHHLAHEGHISIRDANRLDRIGRIAKLAAARLRSDFDWQEQATPLVYLDGEYIELDMLLARVKTWEIAQRQDCDRSSHDFILGEARV